MQALFDATRRRTGNETAPFNATVTAIFLKKRAPISATHCNCGSVCFFGTALDCVFRHLDTSTFVVDLVGSCEALGLANFTRWVTGVLARHRAFLHQVVVCCVAIIVSALAFSEFRRMQVSIRRVGFGQMLCFFLVCDDASASPGGPISFVKPSAIDQQFQDACLLFFWYKG